MISKETEQRMKDMGIICGEAIVMNNCDSLDHDINAALDAIVKHDKKYPIELRNAYLAYTNETKRMRLAGLDTSNRLTDEEFEKQWRKEHLIGND